MSNVTQLKVEQCAIVKKFEFIVIFNSHMLKVISFKNITKIPSKYILKRCTKDAKKGLADASHDNVEVYEDSKKVMATRYRE